jgi:hypothetical protein
LVSKVRRVIEVFKVFKDRRVSKEIKVPRVRSAKLASKDYKASKV